MSTDMIDGPFDSIESAQDFMNVLAETILDAMKDLHYQRQIATRARSAAHAHSSWRCIRPKCWAATYIRAAGL
jgi:hypothetical protein